MGYDVLTNDLSTVVVMPMSDDRRKELEEQQKEREAKVQREHMADDIYALATTAVVLSPLAYLVWRRRRIIAIRMRGALTDALAGGVVVSRKIRAATNAVAVEASQKASHRSSPRAAKPRRFPDKDPD